MSERFDPEQFQSLQEQALKLGSQLQQFSSAAPRTPTTAEDDSGAVTATVSADGQPASWSLGRDWKSRIQPAELGHAFVSAMRNAGAARLALWEQQLAKAKPPAPTPPVEVAPSVSPQPLETLLDTLNALTTAISEPPVAQPASAPEPAPATDLNHPVAVQLDVGKQVETVTFDLSWLGQTASTVITKAANSALDKALASPTDSPDDSAIRDQQRQLNSIFSDALAHLERLGSSGRKENQ